MTEATAKKQTRTVSNAAHGRVGVDGVFAVVGEATGLLDERGRQTVRICPVVHEGRRDEVPDLIERGHLVDLRADEVVNLRCTI